LIKHILTPFSLSPWVWHLEHLEVLGQGGGPPSPSIFPPPSLFPLCPIPNPPSKAILFGGFPPLCLQFPQFPSPVWSVVHPFLIPLTLGNAVYRFSGPAPALFLLPFFSRTAVPRLFFFVFHLPSGAGGPPILLFWGVFGLPNDACLFRLLFFPFPPPPSLFSPTFEILKTLFYWLSRDFFSGLADPSFWNQNIPYSIFSSLLPPCPPPRPSVALFFFLFRRSLTSPFPLPSLGGTAPGPSATIFYDEPAFAGWSYLFSRIQYLFPFSSVFFLSPLELVKQATDLLVPMLRPTKRRPLMVPPP